MGKVSVQGLPERKAGPVTYRTISAGPVMMLYLTIPPHTSLPPHTHENFQMGYVLSGSVSLTIGEERATFQPGMAYTIPEQVSHDLQTQEETVEMLDIYYPPKSDRL